jgi:allantoin racemase
VIAAKATCAAITEALVPDAATIACLSDPGLLRIRQGVIFPVVGIAAVAMSRAVELGPRYSVLTVAPTTVPGILALAEACGMAEHLTGVHALPTGVSRAKTPVTKPLVT